MENRKFNLTVITGEAKKNKGMSIACNVAERT